MHTKKNVCDNLLCVLQKIKDKTKDGLKAQLDLVYLGIRPKLYPMFDKERSKWYIPTACYTLSKAERAEICVFLCSIKGPTGYSSNIRRLVSIKYLKLIGMKYHDYHVMTTQLLPIAIRNVMPVNVRDNNEYVILF